MPLVALMHGVVKAGTTKFLSAADGGKPAYYRMAELYFTSPEELQKAMGSPEGAATSADLANFASGGLTILLGEID